MKKTQDNTKNYTIEHASNRDKYAIAPLHPYSDMRLSLAEFGFLIKLLNLPNQWKITQRATAEHFNINKNTFNNYIKNLIEYGYIEIKKDKFNKATYIIKEKPIKADFDIKNIENYTIKQLNAFLNDSRIEQRYKNLIKKALGQANETSEHFNKLLEDIQQTDQEETQENEKLPFEY